MERKRIEAERLINAAHEACEQGRLAEAATAARAALEIDGDLVDAYVALAYAAATNAERIALLREGVRIGVANLEADERPWYILDNRPAMRAMHNLALALWDDPRPESRPEAAEVLGRLLELNPDDNQGCRWLLPDWYAALGQWEKGEAILANPIYAEDAGAFMGYWRAFYAYRSKRPEAEDLRRKALAANAHVPQMLAASAAPAEKPPHCRRGRPDEAVHYASRTSRKTWRETPGALAWLEAA